MPKDRSASEEYAASGEGGTMDASSGSGSKKPCRGAGAAGEKPPKKGRTKPGAAGVKDRRRGCKKIGKLQGGGGQLPVGPRQGCAT